MARLLLPVGRRRVGSRIAIVSVLALLTLVLLVLIGRVSPDLLEAQRAKELEFDLDRLRRGILLDFVLIVAYVVLGWAVFSLILDPRDENREHVHPTAAAGALLVVGAAAADAVEDLLLWIAIGRAADERSGLLSVMRGFGLVKVTLLLLAAAILLVLLPKRAWRRERPWGLPTDRPPHRERRSRQSHPWDPPAKGDGARIGVCLSGGGIRSAAFCLGGLQALRQKGILQKADYLAAVSGGGYLAAGWAVSDAGPPGGAPAGDRPAWGPGSPEERWFRDHSSYLVPDLKGGLGGFARLLAGVLVNLLVVGLVLFALARPVGWAMHGLHEDLRVEKDNWLLIPRDSEATMVVAGVRPVGTVPAGGGKGPLARFEVHMAPDLGLGLAPHPNDVWFDQWPYDPKDRDVCFNVVEDQPGIIEVESGRAEVVRQPEVKVTPGYGPLFDPCRASPLLEKARIKDHPTLALTDSVFVDESSLAGQVKVAGQPTATVKTGLAAVRHATFEGWMWGLSVGLSVAALVVALAVMLLRARPGRRFRPVGRALARVLAAGGAVAFLLLIGLPWLVVWLPRTLSALVGAGPFGDKGLSPSGSGGQDYVLPGAGLVALMAAAARQFLTANKTGAGTGASKPWYRRIWTGVGKREAQLKWYETSPSKVLVALITLAAAIVLFVNALQFASANGPSGHLMGLALIRDRLPGWLFFSDWVKLVLVVVGLAVFACVTDAHAWSLYPFYKERLSSAFLLRRTDGDRAEPIPYDLLLPFAPAVEATGDRPRWNGMVQPRWKDEDEDGPRRKKKQKVEPRGKPQLVACCAVNLSEYGRVPPGRRAASFTFSSTEIGGPLVGYAEPEEYWRLPPARRRDVTVASAMAISGAAFSPAMGKFNLGPVGTVLALANLRLGVWIPSPGRVQARPRFWQWRALQRPHWGWFLRELANKYALNRRYVYVSDGGHWDNLGLVELLRRGCTEIYCISGAGDGPLSFGTIGEAIALAREELGVEIELDPSPLRPPATDPDPGGPRELRRVEAKDKAAPFAPKAFVKGTFTFTRPPDAPEGTIYYVEADLTSDLPFDVHTFAEAELVFPDDSTGDQIFNHRQFESYRALGHHQTMQVFAPSDDGETQPGCWRRLLRCLAGCDE